MIMEPRIRQTVSFSVLFLMGANLLIGCSYSAEQDSWISLLISIGVLILWGLVLARISVLNPGKDIFGLLTLFPKWLRYFFTMVIAVYCFGQAAWTVRTYAGFARMVSLRNTELIVILVLTCLSIWFFMNREDVVLHRFSYVVFLPIVGIMFLIFLLLVPMFRTEQLFPVLYDNTKEVFVCSLENLSFPFGNAFLLLGLISFPDQPKKERNTWITICAVAGGLSLLIVFQDLLLLGGKLASVLDFPYNFSTSLVNVADFFSRLEVFASLFFFLSAIFRSAYMLKLVSRGIRSLISVPPKSIALPLAALLCGYASIVFESTDEVFNYLSVFPYFAIPIQFGLPISLWICSEVREKKRKNQENFPSSSRKKLL